jgi:hypothetical protein
MAEKKNSYKFKIPMAIHTGLGATAGRARKRDSVFCGSAVRIFTAENLI